MIIKDDGGLNQLSVFNIVRMDFFQGDIRTGYKNFISCSKKSIWDNLYKNAIC